MNVDNRAGNTDLSQEANAAREREALYRRVVETTLEGVWEVDADGVTSFVNDRMASMLGYSVEEMVGRSILDFMDADAQEEGRRLWSGRRAGLAEQHDFRFRRKDGTPLWAISNATPCFDEAGRFAGAFAMVTDITDRKFAEGSLRESRQMLKTVLDTIPARVFWKDADLVFLGCNLRFAEDAGLQSPDEIVGKTDYDMPWTEQAGGFQADDRLVMESGRPKIGYEEQETRADGSTFWLRTSKIPLHDNAGRVVGVLGTYEDITESKQAEAALREKEERFRYIIKHDPNAIAVLDNSMRYMMVSDRFLKDYGLGEQDVVGRHHYELFPEMPERWKEIHQRVLNGAIEGAEDDSFERPDGSVDYNRWECRPWRHSDGSIGGLVMYTEVITERKHAEFALRASEAKYRGLYESMTDAFLSTDMDGRIGEYNEPFRDMLGYEPGELEQLTYMDLTPEKWHAPEAEIVRDQIVARGYSDVYEKEYRRKDGTVIPVELRVSLLRDEQGHPSHMWGIVRDITERVREKELNDALSAIKSITSGTLDYDDILRGILEKATDAIGTDGGLVMERGEGNWLYRHAYRYPADVMGSRIDDDLAAYTMRACKEKRVVVVDDVMGSGEQVPELAYRYDVRSVMVVPLVVRDNVIGSLLFTRHGRAIAFSEAEIEFARELQTLASAALGNVRLFEAQKLAAGREARARQVVQRQFSLLQQALIPSKPRIGGDYDVAARYIAAAPGQSIGGDFYDVFKTEEGKVGILLGDVAGKDIEAAALAVATRGTARAFAYEISSPAAAVKHTNTLLCSHATGDASFSSIFLAVLDTATGDIRYSTAGHPPPAICRMDGSVEILAYGAPPVGLELDAEFKEAGNHLGPGDKLVIYTDGISEARRGHELFEVWGVERVVKEHYDCSAEQMVDALVAAAREWAEGNLTDDIAIIVVERGQKP